MAKKKTDAEVIKDFLAGKRPKTVKTRIEVTAGQVTVLQHVMSAALLTAVQVAGWGRVVDNTYKVSLKLPNTKTTVQVSMTMFDGDWNVLVSTK